MAETLNSAQFLALIRDTLDAGKPLSLLFDYDGTLTPIVARPEDAVLGEAMRATLQRLEKFETVRLAVISGRPEPVLRDFLHGLEHTTMIGDHGATLANPERHAAAAAHFRHALAWLPRKYPGCALEDKGTAVGVHFRQANPDSAPALMADFFDWWLAHGNLSDFQVATGKKVFEIKPRTSANKGTAVLGLLEQWHGEVWTARTLAVFCGDDTTDEDAFTALARAPEHAAATILVAANDRPTRARLRLPDVPALQALLVRILEILDSVE